MAVLSKVFVDILAYAYKLGSCVRVFLGAFSVFHQLFKPLFELFEISTRSFNVVMHVINKAAYDIYLSVNFTHITFKVFYVNVPYYIFCHVFLLLIVGHARCVVLLHLLVFCCQLIF